MSPKSSRRHDPSIVAGLECSGSTFENPNAQDHSGKSGRHRRSKTPREAGPMAMADNRRNNPSGGKNLKEQS
ncbi:hypothetical protein GCM10007880_57450 [Mesorhizobium amorphae]|nr:hypothetical protein GCM10007880_57450 [Mesorhizobium amorphae]